MLLNILVLSVFNYMIQEVQSLSIGCEPNKNGNDLYLYAVNGRCNKRQRYCDCNTKNTIEVKELDVCLDKQKLGDICVHSIQCQNNAICLNAESDELSQIHLIDTRLLSQYFRERHQRELLIGKTIKIARNFGYKSLGKCQCMAGYRRQKTSSKGWMCQKFTLENIICIGSHQCLDKDPNSHCDAISNRCFCDPGYLLNTDWGECRMSAKKFSDHCNYDIECINWDTNMECQYSSCFCKKGYEFEYLTQRCKPMDRPPKKCSYGLKWDVTTGDCEAYHLYGLRQNDYRFLSTDKLLETVVIVIFCCVTLAIMRFWRNILPQHIYANYQSGMFSDFSYTNRVQRRRSSRNNNNSLARSGRVIQLRVNLDSPETQFLPEETFVELPLTASHSSLPPYEVANTDGTTGHIYLGSDDDTQPPPYTDEPPTYEEAIALSLLNNQPKEDNKESQ